MSENLNDVEYAMQFGIRSHMHYLRLKDAVVKAMLGHGFGMNLDNILHAHQLSMLLQEYEDRNDIKKDTIGESLHMGMVEAGWFDDGWFGLSGMIRKFQNLLFKN